MPERVTFWERTKQLSTSAYDKALKPGFDKAYTTVNKLEPHVNRLSHKVGSETFWPGELDKESDKAARILRSFCKDGVYDQIDEDTAKKAEDAGVDLKTGIPKGKQRVIKKIPASVIQNAKGLAIFTCMRYGWVIGGSGGAGVLVGRHPETGEWSPPSGIHMQNMSLGFLIGVDLLDTVLVINSYEALEAFTKLRCTLGTEVGVAAGPLGIGGLLETSVHKKPAPVWSYVKSRGLYGGVAIDGNIIIERSDENARFYDEEVKVAKILKGEVRRPPVEKYKMLHDTIRAAEGQSVDESLLPDGIPPSDMELAPEGPTFGIPDEDDPDPFGFKALEAQGMTIREAGTHRRATPDSFEFRPSPTSPVYSTYRKSLDTTLKRKDWRNSTISNSSVDRSTQTDEEDASQRGESPHKISEAAPVPPPLPERNVTKSSPPPLPDREIVESPAEELKRDLQAIDAKTDTDEKATGGLQSNIPDIIESETKEEKLVPEAEAQTAQTENESGAKKDRKDGDAKHEKLHSKSDDEADEDSSDDDYSDFESDVEISTAVPVTARPKPGVVNIPQRIAPALPARNPERVSRSPLIEQSATMNGFEQVEISSHETDFDLQNPLNAGKMNGHIQDPTAQPHLSNGVYQVEDEFHSVPPSPQHEQMQHEILPEPIRQT